MAHPWRTLLPVIALLLLLGSPFLNFRLGLSGADMLSKDAESRRGEELLDRQFPDISAYPMVMLDYPQESPLTKERIGEAYDLSRWLENRPSVKEVSGIVNLNPELSRDQYQELLSGPREDLPSQVREALNRTTEDHVTVLTAYTSVGYNTDSAYDLVREVREEHPDVGRSARRRLGSLRPRPYRFGLRGRAADDSIRGPRHLRGALLAPRVCAVAHKSGSCELPFDQCLLRSTRLGFPGGAPLRASRLHPRSHKHDDPDYHVRTIDGLRGYAPESYQGGVRADG